MNFSFKNIFMQQRDLHPSLTPQDALKLCYQAAFGAEHLLEDLAGAEQFLLAEYNELPACDAENAPLDEPLFEQISSNFCRVNLRAWKQKQLPPQWLFRLFAQSTPQATLAKPAQEPTAPALQFHHNIAHVSALCQSGQLPFAPTEWEPTLATYLAAGVRAVHHSAQYRTAERPAYRLIHTRFLPLLPLLERLIQLPPTPAGRAYTIAIDGRCGAGKSTLAQALCQTLQTEAIQMDDFFLPPAKRTPERLAAPGGNIDYERFAAEVLPHLNSSDAFAYQRFHCASMQLGEMRPIPQSSWHVVEGSYSHHPYFASYADLRVFVTIHHDAQLARILARNGADWAKDFAEKWIPLEEAYFAAKQTEQQADLVLCTEE